MHVCVCALCLGTSFVPHVLSPQLRSQVDCPRTRLVACVDWLTGFGDRNTLVPLHPAPLALLSPLLPVCVLKAESPSLSLVFHDGQVERKRQLFARPQRQGMHACPHAYLSTIFVSYTVKEARM